MKTGNGRVKDSSSRRIVITGFMGAGKTTVAAALAEHLGCEMLDLDDFLVEREGRLIPAIIDEDGEERFREAETGALRNALDHHRARIISLGGGAWTIERNRSLIDERDCLSVWIDAPFDICWRRITSVGGGDVRPLARDREKTRKLYDQRRPIYALAKLRVENHDKNDISRVINLITNAIFDEE